MNMKKNRILSFCMVVVLTTSIVLSTPMTAFAEITGVTLIADVSVNSGVATVIDAELVLSGVGNLTGATVIINDNFDKTKDSLSYVATGGLTANYNNTTGILTISGTADIGVYQTFLRTVQFNTSDTSGTRKVNFSVTTSTSNAVYNSPTEHFYEFVPAHKITWTAARDAAAARSYNGMTGYLATVSSQAENDFIKARCLGAGWLGGSDADEEGVWKWVTGPENETIFWIGDTDGSAVEGVYNNWKRTTPVLEPNDGGGSGEDYLHIVGPAGLWGEWLPGMWNDFSGVAANEILGYVVEYGDQTIGDSVVIISNFSATTTITISSPIQLINDGGAALDTYTDAGIIGVTGGNLAEINAAVAAAKIAKGSDLTAGEIQTAVNKVLAIAAINAGGATLANYTDAGITGVTAGNLAAVNTEVASAKTTKGSDLTAAEIQAAVNKVLAASSGGGGGGGSSDSGSPPAPGPTAGQNPVIVIVNGVEQNAGIVTQLTEGGQSVTVVTVNNQIIESKIDEAIRNNPTGEGNVFQVPVADRTAEAVRIQLTGDIIQKLADNSFEVSILKDNVEYRIPAEEFSIGKVAADLGVSPNNLRDITVEVRITQLDQAVVDKYNEMAQANGAQLIFPPVSFEVVARVTNADGTTSEVEISRFSNYVERVMEIPPGVDPSKITTGIVFNPDGTYSHVPTEVFQQDGKWYARISSLTNSSYSVIWNPLRVASVENHWSRDTVNDMASRLVIFNHDTFAPDKPITRADFAEYIVRALGLYRTTPFRSTGFSDVSAGNARAAGIVLANQAGIVSGYPDGTFKPNALITRQEAMSMYRRAMVITKLRGAEPGRYQSFSDYDQVSDWARESVKETLSARVFNGTTATTISPKSNLTYAEAAAAIKNLLVKSKLINQ